MTAPRHRRGATPARTLVGVVVVSLVVGVAAGRVIGQPEQLSPQASRPAQPSPPSPGNAGVPVGSARPAVAHGQASAPDGDAAIEAAIGFVLSGERLVGLDKAAAAEAIRTMSTEANGDRIANATLDKLRAARAALAEGTGPIVFRQGVLAARLDDFADGRARVVVWSVGVLARVGIAPPQAGWATSVVDLVWERGGWRVSAESVTPGPAPILNDSIPPATAADLVEYLAAFDMPGVSR